MGLDKRPELGPHVVLVVLKVDAALHVRSRRSAASGPADGRLRRTGLYAAGARATRAWRRSRARRGARAGAVGRRGVLRIGGGAAIEAGQDCQYREGNSFHRGVLPYQTPRSTGPGKWLKDSPNALLASVRFAALASCAVIFSARCRSPATRRPNWGPNPADKIRRLFSPFRWIAFPPARISSARSSTRTSVPAPTK